MATMAKHVPVAAYVVHCVNCSFSIRSELRVDPTFHDVAAPRFRSWRDPNDLQQHNQTQPTCGNPVFEYCDVLNAPISDRPSASNVFFRPEEHLSPEMKRRMDFARQTLRPRRASW
jgi:hypothetical protein